MAEDRKQDLKERIQSLPSGYISKKNIHGKVYYYYQWSENGKKKSKYLDPEKADVLRSQIDLRKKLQLELKNQEFEQNYALAPSTETKPFISFADSFSCEVKVGSDLFSLYSPTRYEHRRDQVELLKQYLYDKQPQVFILFGLRRTGKTTILLQAISDLADPSLAKCAYIRMSRGFTYSSLDSDLKKLLVAGYRYVFIDDITYLQDFMDSAGNLFDSYACYGMRIVLSGTFSLGFELASRSTLYEKCILCPTTFLSYREAAHVFGDWTLKKQMTQNPFSLSDGGDEWQFVDSYLDAAIVQNIAFSLVSFDKEFRFRELSHLMQAEDLKVAVQQVVEELHLQFLAEALQDESSIALTISRYQAEVVNRQKFSDCCKKQILECMRLVDFIVGCPDRKKQETKYLFVQPWLRYKYAIGLLHNLLIKSGEVLKPDFEAFCQQKVLIQVIKEEILLEMLSLKEESAIFSQAKNGNAIEVLDVHSGQRVFLLVRISSQIENFEITEPIIGKDEIAYVLYLGPSQISSSGIRYKNIAEFLTELGSLKKRKTDKRILKK
jgi:hypothetical protein